MRQALLIRRARQSGRILADCWSHDVKERVLKFLLRANLGKKSFW